MAIDVTAETEIAAPASDVAAYAFDPANDSAWTKGIKSAEMLTSPPVGRGTRVRRVAKFLGRPIHYVMEVVDFEPDRRMTMHAVEAPFPMDVTYELEPRGERRTHARIRVRGTGGYGPLGPLLGTIVRRSITSDVRTLKRILESR